MPDGSDNRGSALGGVRWLLRLEGLAIFGFATALYVAYGGSWWLYLALLVAPDLAFVAYFAGPRVGAIVYNAVHSIVGPLILGGYAFLSNAEPLLVMAALVWLAHVGLDRALGFGLKYASGFTETHLGHIGRAASGGR